MPHVYSLAPPKNGLHLTYSARNEQVGTTEPSAGASADIAGQAVKLTLLQGCSAL